MITKEKKKFKENEKETKLFWEPFHIGGQNRGLKGGGGDIRQGDRRPPQKVKEWCGIKNKKCKGR